jgi:hypothetical protein
MNKLTEAFMYKFAKMYANKGNFTKTGIPILDERLSLPRDCHNAGSWFGFIAGFKLCYALMTGIYQNDTTTTTTSNIESDDALQKTSSQT